MCVDHISRDAQYVFHMCFFDADLDMFMLPRHLFDFWEAHCNPQKTNTCRQKKIFFPSTGSAEHINWPASEIVMARSRML